MTVMIMDVVLGLGIVKCSSGFLMNCLFKFLSYHVFAGLVVKARLDSVILANFKRESKSIVKTSFCIALCHDLISKVLSYGAIARGSQFYLPPTHEPNLPLLHKNSPDGATRIGDAECYVMLALHF